MSPSISTTRAKEPTIDLAGGGGLGGGGGGGGGLGGGLGRGGGLGGGGKGYGGADFLVVHKQPSF